MSPYVASVVIPAHDEEAGIGRLLGRLVTDPALEIVVAANGCTDGTVAAARAFTGVTVLDLPTPSKQAAMRAADEAATTLPRVYIDADVEIDAASVRRLLDALDRPGVEAAAPTRELPMTGVNPLVRSYYRVWQELPSVTSGVFGRGVIAVSAEGYRRIAALPPVLSDDLAISEAFAPHERVVIPDAVVVVRPPKTIADLMRRRVRVQTGVHQADESGLRAASTATSPRDLVGLVRARPRLAVHLPTFVAVTVAGRVAARRRIRAGDYRTWSRDQSSRTP